MSKASSIGDNACLHGWFDASAVQFGLYIADPGTTGASEVSVGKPGDRKGDKDGFEIVHGR